MSATVGPRIHDGFARIFRSAALFGAGSVITAYLRLPPDPVLPLSIPHGVDTYFTHAPLDLHTYEPIYLAHRADVAERAAAVKKVLLFPHPWFLLNELEHGGPVAGTLFIGPPSSEHVFDRMYAAICEQNCPKPWGILLKDRGLSAADVQWWRDRGFSTPTAGSILEERFYYNLRDIIARYEAVATANMSSAVVFAAAMGKSVVAIPGIELELVETGDILQAQDFDDVLGNIKRVWIELLFGAPERGQRQAQELMGYRYLEAPEVLRDKYLAALSCLGAPIHLHPVRPGHLLTIMAWLIRWGVPLHKLFPHPRWQLRERIRSVFRRNRLTILEGSDLAHYGVTGSRKPLRIRVVPSSEIGDSVQPGFAVRKLRLRARPTPCGSTTVGSPK